MCGLMHDIGKLVILKLATTTAARPASRRRAEEVTSPRSTIATPPSAA